MQKNTAQMEVPSVQPVSPSHIAKMSGGLLFKRFAANCFLQLVALVEVLLLLPFAVFVVLFYLFLGGFVTFIQAGNQGATRQFPLPNIFKNTFGC